jgi:tryptophan-rich sensory protein
MIIRLLIFGLLNFGGLAIGAYFTNPGVASDWYQNMNQAPWTPPGWVFGAAWTTIMICFTIYLALLWDELETQGPSSGPSPVHQASDEAVMQSIRAKNKAQLVYLYISALILNVVWNFIFFYLHQVGMAAIVISALTLIVFFFGFRYWDQMKTKTLLLAPYAIWMCIATSLNVYALVMN